MSVSAKRFDGIVKEWHFKRPILVWQGDAAKGQLLERARERSDDASSVKPLKAERAQGFVMC